MLNLLVSAILISSAPTVVHAGSTWAAPQTTSGRPVNPRETNPAPDAGPAMCTQVGAGGEFEHVSLAEYDDWLTEHAPAPKDDYETGEQYEQRRLRGWQDLVAANPLIVVSHNFEVTRHNSQYDPATQVLTVEAPSEADCVGSNSWQCLLLNSSDESREFSRFLAIGGLDVGLYQPLRMAPEAARRLRDGVNQDEITIFIVTAMIAPYLSHGRERFRTSELYPVRGYCVHFHWND